MVHSNEKENQSPEHLKMGFYFFFFRKRWRTSSSDPDWVIICYPSTVSCGFSCLESVFALLSVLLCHFKPLPPFVCVGDWSQTVAELVLEENSVMEGIRLELEDVQRQVVLAISELDRADFQIRTCSWMWLSQNDAVCPSIERSCRENEKPLGKKLLLPEVQGSFKGCYMSCIQLNKYIVLTWTWHYL